VAHNSIVSTSTNNGSTVTNPSQSTASKYYVHPSDGPNFVKVTPILDKSNYLSWAWAIRRALMVNNKFQFVDGSIPISALLDPNRQACEWCCDLIHSWISYPVSPQIAQLIVFIENILDVWIELKKKKNDSSNLIVLLLLSYDMIWITWKQGSLFVTNYFTELKIPLDELESHRPLP